MKLYNILGQLKVKLNKSFFKFCEGKYAIRNIQGYKMILDTDDVGISLDLLNKGVREKDIYFKYKEKINVGDVVLDIGANIGYYALMSSNKVGDPGKVYAVEPVTSNYNLLRSNIYLNQMNNVEHYNYAFGDKNKLSFINLFDNESNRHTLRENTAASNKTEIINMITVDKFLKNKVKPNVIRMDVEGFEYEILKGMKQTLKEPSLKLIYLELHCMYLTPEQSKEILTMLYKHNFKVKLVVFEKGEGLIAPLSLQLEYWSFNMQWDINTAPEFNLMCEVENSKFGYGILFERK